jgi:hypothetical protein
LIIAGIVSAIAAYNLHHTTRKRLLFRIGFWLTVYAGLVFAEPLYGLLFSHNLTRTEPLSLFDVIQITGIIFTIFIANQAYIKADLLEQRVQDLHQELSIRLSDVNKKRSG